MTWRSGFCNPANPDDSHKRCRGVGGDRECVCECHADCAPADQVPTEDGVYDGISDATYHGDHGSLSSSGARALLAGSPAQFHYDREHPRPPRNVFDHGHAAHRLVLGAGPELALIDADEWRTKAIKAQVADVRQRGGVPLRPKDWQMVHDMAKVLRDHPEAAALLDPEHGMPEQSLYWHHPATGTRLRARVDWHTKPSTPYRRTVIDYKTAATADPDDFLHSARRYGYHQQQEWYSDGIRATGVAQDFDFLFIVQSKTPPHLVSVCRLANPEDLQLARERNDEAIRLYAACVAANSWPGYPGITELDEPTLYRRSDELEMVI